MVRMPEPLNTPPPLSAGEIPSATPPHRSLLQRQIPTAAHGKDAKVWRPTAPCDRAVIALDRDRAGDHWQTCCPIGGGVVDGGGALCSGEGAVCPASPATAEHRSPATRVTTIDREGLRSMCQPSFLALHAHVSKGSTSNPSLSSIVSCLRTSNDGAHSRQANDAGYVNEAQARCRVQRYCSALHVAVHSLQTGLARMRISRADM